MLQSFKTHPKPCRLATCFSLHFYRLCASSSSAPGRCRKYPSSYPDFSTRPFCITTLTRPVKRSESNNCSIDADNTSASRTFRRNSPKFLSSIELSGFLVIALSRGALLAHTLRRCYSCGNSQSRLNDPNLPVENFRTAPPVCPSEPAPLTIVVSSYFVLPLLSPAPRTFLIRSPSSNPAGKKRILKAI